MKTASNDPRHRFIHCGPPSPLLAVMRHQLPGESVKGLKRMIDRKGIVVAGKLALQGNIFVHPGQEVVCDISKIKASTPIEKIHEDESICIINKPPYLTCSQEAIAKALGPSYRLCHRLDKETSGVLVLAKTAQALAHLEKQFLEKSIKKKYLAIVKSRVPLPEKWVVDQPIAIVKRLPQQVIMGIHPAGQQALTEFRRVQKKGAYALLECFPHTGRTHQIRVHLAYSQSPIVGDSRYGGEACSGRFLLHALEMTFIHPKTLLLVQYSALVPEDFKKLSQ